MTPYEDEVNGQKHPVYRFYDGDEDYVCEVRYGSGTANALQRGLWTHTKNGLKYFDSVTESGHLIAVGAISKGIEGRQS